MKRLLLHLVLVVVASRIEAQGVHLRFEGLQATEALSEQFAGLGVHFAGPGRFPYYAFVRAAPSSLQPIASKLATFEGGGDLWFDHPIASVSMLVAFERLGVGDPNGDLTLHLGEMDRYPPTVALWSSLTPIAGFYTWAQAIVNVPADRTVFALALTSQNILRGVNYGARLYIAELNVTYVPVPEPSTLALGTVGIAALLSHWQYRRRKRATVVPVA